MKKHNSNGFFAHLKESLKKIFFIYEDPEDDYDDSLEEDINISEENSAKAILLKDLADVDSLLDKINSLKISVSRLKFSMPNEYNEISKEILIIEERYRELSESFSKSTSNDLITSYDPEKNNDLLLRVVSLQEKLDRLIEGDLKYLHITRRVNLFISKLQEMYRLSITFSERKMNSAIKDLISQAGDAFNIVTNEDISVMYDIISNAQKEDLNTKIFIAKYLIEKTKIRYLKDADLNLYFEGNKNDFLLALMQDLKNISDEVSAFKTDDDLLLNKLKNDVEKLQQFNYLSDPIKAFTSKKFWADLFALEDALYIPKKVVQPKEKTLKAIKNLGETVDNKAEKFRKTVFGRTLKEKCVYFLSEEITKVSLENKEKCFALSLVLYYLLAEPITAKQLLNLILLFELEDVVFNDYPEIKGYQEFKEEFESVGFDFSKYNSDIMNSKKEKLLNASNKGNKYYNIKLGEEFEPQYISLFEDTLKNLKIDAFISSEGVISINSVYFQGYPIQK